MECNDDESTDSEIINVPDEGGLGSDNERDLDLAGEEAPAPEEPIPSRIPAAVPTFDPNSPMHHLPDSFDENEDSFNEDAGKEDVCLLYTSPSPRD